MAYAPQPFGLGAAQHNNPFVSYQGRFEGPQSEIELNPTPVQINPISLDALIRNQDAVYEVVKTADSPKARIIKSIAIGVFATLAVIGLIVAHVATLGIVSVALIGAIALYDLIKGGIALGKDPDMKEQVHRVARKAHMQQTFSLLQAQRLQQQNQVPAQNPAYNPRLA